MHVLHRPHLPRLFGVSIAAAFLAIVISLALALASSLSNISQPASGTRMSVHRSAPARTSVLHTNAPRWASNPFASLLSRPLAQPWLIARH